MRQNSLLERSSGEVYSASVTETENTKKKRKKGLSETRKRKTGPLKSAGKCICTQTVFRVLFEQVDVDFDQSAHGALEFVRRGQRERRRRNDGHEAATNGGAHLVVLVQLETAKNRKQCSSKPENRHEMVGVRCKKNVA